MNSYNLLKILHIVSAGTFSAAAASITYSWIKKELYFSTAFRRTKTLILPAAIFQLVSGCTLVSWHHSTLIQSYVVLTFEGFLGLLVAWFLFLYFLLSGPSARWAQGICLSIAIIAFIVMIFAMSNMAKSAS